MRSPQELITELDREMSTTRFNVVAIAVAFETRVMKGLGIGICKILLADFYICGFVRGRAACDSQKEE